MNRTRTLLVACALALPISAVVAGCGEDEASNEDPQEVLTATFENDNTVSSGVLDLSLDITAEGDQGGNFAVGLSGPFQSDPENPNAIPQLDLAATASGEGAGQSIDFEGGLVVTEDNAFIEYGGDAYEVGTETFSQLQEQAEAQTGTEEGETSTFREQCETAIEAQNGDPSACDFDVSAWFTNLSNEGTEDVGGAETTHVAGDLDVATMLGDLFRLGTSVPGANVQGLSPEVIQSQLDTAAQAISSADFDVYSATEDDTLRQLDFTLGIDPSAVPGGETAGVDAINVSFSVSISDAGSDQTIEAPADARPIEELQGALGGLVPGASLPGVTPGGSGIPGAGDPSQECIAQATTPEDITACLEQS